MIVLLLIGESAVCVLAVFWPNFLGIDVRPASLVRALQRSYAVPGHEQFTAAIDLVQTMVRINQRVLKRIEDPIKAQCIFLIRFSAPPNVSGKHYNIPSHVIPIQKKFKIKFIILVLM